MTYHKLNVFKIKLIIAQLYIRIVQGGLNYKLKNGACMIIPHPTVELKHI